MEKSRTRRTSRPPARACKWLLYAHNELHCQAVFTPSRKPFCRPRKKRASGAFNGYHVGMGKHSSRHGGKSPARPPGKQPEADILYGLHTCSEALKNPRREFLSALVTRNALARLGDEFAAAGVEPEVVLPKELDRRLGGDAVHQGVMLTARPLAQPRLDQIARSGLVVMLDQVTDPHNVGAIVRSACAFNVTAVVTTARHSPLGSAVMAKAASGALEHVPFVKVTNLARAMDELKDYGFEIFGLDSDAPGMLDCAMDVPDAAAIVLGAEGKGLRQLTRGKCDHLARLPLPGPIRSLNVSNAAAIALYAMTRAA